MGTLTKRSIDWIERAPIRIEATGESTASPEAVFAVLADHERWTEWFPSVREVTVLGPASGVGARRRVRVPGLVVDEEFIAWEPGVRWAFTGTEFRPRITRSLVEDCRLQVSAAGGTSISYGMYLDPPALLAPLVRASSRRIRSNIETALVNLARRAEAAG